MELGTQVRTIVIRLAGGPKATVVKYFGNKAGLFAAAMVLTARENNGWTDARYRGEDRLEPALQSLLRGLLAFCLRPDSLTVYRGQSHGIASLSGGYTPNLPPAVGISTWPFCIYPPIIPPSGWWLNTKAGERLRPDSR